MHWKRHFAECFRWVFEDGGRLISRGEGLGYIGTRQGPEIAAPLPFALSPTMDALSSPP